MVNSNKTAEINVMSAKFKTDTGVYSDQDPYIRFVYNGGEINQELNLINKN